MMPRAVQEEIVAALWLIAALLAKIVGIDWLAYGLFIKAAADAACVFYVAIQERKEPRP